jgi:hypothetical protein
MTQEPSQKEILQKELRFCTNQYRIAVRWLRDAKVYKQAHVQDLTFEGKAWKGSQEGDLATDASKAYSEAVSGVLHWRRRINNCNEKLMDLAGGKNGRREA